MTNFYSLSVAVLLLHASLLLDLTHGFSSGLQRSHRFQSHVGYMTGNGEDANGLKQAEPDKNIPSSKTLGPFAPYPMERLDNGGKVTLVGSGPGDPELLTVSAYKLLQDPETFFICDRLVSPEIIDLIAGEVKIARKVPGCAELAQEEIYSWAHDALSRGKHVVRLKIGDPFVFGRGGEEVILFRRFGIEPKIIPVSHNVVGWQHPRTRI